jgi:DNA-binding transcriptional LysR family regulator
MYRLIAIETFIKVVELNSFTEASEALGVSRTMASKHVADLEAAIGTRLLNRTTRSLSLTEAGSEFFDGAKAGLALLDEAQAKAANLSIRPTGKLRLNAPMSFGILHVATVIPAFAKEYPGLKIDLSLNDRVVDLIDEGFDMAIRIGRLKDSSLVARRLASCRMFVCASPGYLSEHGTPETPEDLERHACLAYTLWSDRDLWRFERDGNTVEVKIAGPLLSNNGDAVTAAAIGGAGLVLQPTFIVGDALRDGRLTRVLAEWATVDLAIFAVFPPGRTPSLKARSFAEFLSQRFKPAPYWDKDI